jgi:hypothetical protein
MRRIILLAVLLVAGCGTASAPASRPSTHRPTHTASPSPPPGPQAFLAIVRKAGFGDKDVASASDSLLLHIGKILCDALDSGGRTAGWQAVDMDEDHHR